MNTYIPVNEKDLGLIEALAAKKSVSIPQMVHDLISRGLEYQEDVYFSKVADERLTNTTEWIEHKEAWK